MNIDLLRNLCRQEAIKALGELIVTKLGNVTSYNPDTYCAKVQLTDDEDSETGWLPVGALAVGNGCGIFCPPNIGDQVEVQFVQGNINAGVVTLCVFQKGNPLAVPSGEYWIFHNSGSFLKFTNDGAVQIQQLTGTTLELAADGSFALDQASGNGLSMGAAGALTITAASVASTGAWAQTGALTVTGVLGSTVAASGVFVASGHTVTVVNGIVVSIV